MSIATIANDLFEPIVYTVHGLNWEANVSLDEMNSSLEDVVLKNVEKLFKDTLNEQLVSLTLTAQEMQRQEAATRAMSAFMGRNNGVEIRLNDGEETPKVGTVVYVHIKDAHPNTGEHEFVHELLANDGYYKESFEKLLIYVEQHKQVVEEQAKQEEAKKAILQQLADLNAPVKPKVRKKKK